MAGILAPAQSTPFSLLFPYLKPFGLPQPMHPLDVHSPTFLAKKHRDPPVPESGPANRQTLHLCNQSTLVVVDDLFVPLARPRLADRSADPSLGVSQPVPQNLHRPAPTGWAHKFFEEISIASFMISISIRWSEMIFLSR